MYFKLKISSYECMFCFSQDYLIQRFEPQGLLVKSCIENAKHGIYHEKFWSIKEKQMIIFQNAKEDFVMNVWQMVKISFIIIHTRKRSHNCHTKFFKIKQEFIFTENTYCNKNNWLIIFLSFFPFFFLIYFLR